MVIHIYSPNLIQSIHNYLSISLVIANVIVVSLLAPLLDGIERRVKARIQCRRGPPIMQTWYDIIKLLRKGSVTQGPLIFKLMPYIAFITSLLTLSLLPTLFSNSLSFVGDIVVFIYLLATPSVLIAIGSIYTGSPLASLGSCREISLWMAYELILAFSIATLAINKSSLLLRRILPPYPPLHPSVIVAIALIAFLTYAEGSRLPYDIPEAESELSGGIILEYGGAELGFAIYSLLIKRVVLTSLLIDLILPRSGLINLLSNSINISSLVSKLVIIPAIYILLLIMFSIIYSTIEALHGRLRIDQALTLLKRIAVIAGVVTLAALMGF